jgi:hypothetical protein
MHPKIDGFLRKPTNGNRRSKNPKESLANNNSPATPRGNDHDCWIRERLNDVDPGEAPALATIWSQRISPPDGR